jgi:hypothetical protein
LDTYVSNNPMINKTMKFELLKQYCHGNIQLD